MNPPVVSSYCFLLQVVAVGLEIMISAPFEGKQVESDSWEHTFPTRAPHLGRTARGVECGFQVLSTRSWLRGSPVGPSSSLFFCCLDTNTVDDATVNNYLVSYERCMLVCKHEFLSCC